MKSRLLILTALLTAGITGAAPSAPVTISPAIIPQPQSMQVSTGQPGFCLKNGIKVHYKVSRSEPGSAAVRALMAAGLPVLPEENTGELTVEIVPHDNPEWHSIRVSPEGIELKIASEKALPAAAQTLAQSVVKSADGSPALPCMQVQDAPLPPLPRAHARPQSPPAHGKRNAQDATSSTACTGTWQMTRAGALR